MKQNVMYSIKLLSICDFVLYKSCENNHVIITLGNIKALQYQDYKF